MGLSEQVGQNWFTNFLVLRIRETALQGDSDWGDD